MTGNERRGITVRGSRLKQEYARTILVLKAIGGGIWDYDVASGVLTCNRRWHEIIGLDYRTQQITSVEAFRAFIHLDDVEMATRVDLESLKRLVAEHERYVAEYRIVRPDGGIRRIRSVACLVGERSANLRAIGCITDITASAPSGEDADRDASEATSRLTVLPLAHASEQPVHLSAHERESLWWVSYGKTAWETAAILGKSQRTVEYHLANAIRKLGAANKVHAAVLAIRRNLL